MPLLIYNVNTLVWDIKENSIKIQYFDWLLGYNPFSEVMRPPTRAQELVQWEKSCCQLQKKMQQIVGQQSLCLVFICLQGNGKKM